MGFLDFLSKARSGASKALGVTGSVLKRVGDVAGAIQKPLGAIASVARPVVDVLEKVPGVGGIASVVDKGLDFVQKGGVERLGHLAGMAGNVVGGAGRAIGGG